WVWCVWDNSTAPPSQNSLNERRAQSHRIVTSARARKRRQANGERGVRHGEGREAAAGGGRAAGPAGAVRTWEGGRGAPRSPDERLGLAAQERGFDQLVPRQPALRFLRLMEPAPRFFVVPEALMRHREGKEVIEAAVTAAHPLVQGADRLLVAARA